MIGYSRERVGYRLFDIERDTIIEERNVFFDESIKGGYLLNKSYTIMMMIGISRMFLKYQTMIIRLWMII